MGVTHCGDNWLPRAGMDGKPGDTLLKPHLGLTDAGDSLVLVEHILHPLQPLGRCERG
jgi:hypothetical protein